ncbi:hypothetical protein G0Q06_01450 [Puniceicoccales bacterium CK1056]|uniref:Uncharacterized protein n=1 Tax=Oceanipulchritudo coccoides TaxID=2706888 RepID=A0A6B2LX25_9BACT|nr:hypothetical protein [Oceanipulchritudo coccoides]NDV61108.1 hypothetical protein [Oceanipulchritudo coccoides]
MKNPLKSSSETNLPWWRRELRFLDRALNPLSRGLMLVAAVLFALVVLFPLWRITLVAPQYQEGLRLTIYAYQLVGGNGGQDLVEINNLNHYIGMKPIEESDFVEITWLPFVLGIFVILSLRAAVLGRISQVIDILVLFTYLGLFSLGLFYHRLYTYGHDLDPKAPMTIEPFTPVIIGKNKIANFVQWSYPSVGGWLMLLIPVVLVLAVWFSRKGRRA